jgi:hypothetical protein
MSNVSGTNIMKPGLGMNGTEHHQMGRIPMGNLSGMGSGNQGVNRLGGSVGDHTELSCPQCHRIVRERDAQYRYHAGFIVSHQGLLRKGMSMVYCFESKTR